jgi:calcium-dependent protein kinase
MYLLLVGNMPFQGKKIEEIKSKILIGKYDNKCPMFNQISIEGQNLINELLNKDYMTRIDAGKVLQHPWFLKYKETESINENSLIKVKQNLKEFKLKDKLQLAALAFIVHFIDTNDEMSKLVEVFRSMDTDGDGRLTFKELVDGLTSIKGKFVSEVEISNIFQLIDQDKNGFIDYEEFIRVCIDRTNILSEKNLQLAFDNFDRDKDGILNSEDIKMILGTEDNEYCIEVIKKIDQNNDGKINFEEFSNLMRNILTSNTVRHIRRSKTTIESNIISDKFNVTIIKDKEKQDRQVRKNSKSSLTIDPVKVPSSKKMSLFNKDDDDDD